MSNYFDAARAWLTAITPDLPPALLIVFVFVSVFLLRKWFPAAWVRFEHAVPFVDTIDPGPGLKVLLKFWQAIPGAVLAAVGGALFAGTSVKLAVWAVVSTAVAAAAHEIGTDYATLKSASRLRVQASIRKPPSSGSGFVGPAILLLATGFALHCTGCAWAKDALWPPIQNCLPSSAALLSQVTSLLLAGGDYESSFEQIAKTDGIAPLECALKEAVADLSGANSKFSPKVSSDAAARGRAFLAKKGVVVQ